MKNARGIPANQTRYTDRRKRERLVFEFVSDDGNTPSACTVRVGDKDPLTGETITDMDFFIREYYREEDRQVYRNLENSRRPYTGEQKARREQMKREFIRDFEAAHGYRPSRDDIRYHLEQKEPERYHLCPDRITNSEGEPADEFAGELIRNDEDPFGCDLPEDLYALREIAENLPDRLKPVYEAMLQRAAGGADRITLSEVAQKKGVSYNQVMKDTRAIIRIIREKIGGFF